ncbi:E3 ubiquitin-protein ligase UPL5 [Magnolia sinica]|uniref:E3 ubiquitin-protein ligase UPL5 n=1 Tax=Magnolia sinica TaxID=86752 RepID=UPI0026587FC9|nr:E3 ubiquitin-protein ligase UPL5 [Magnolia sinica]
MSLGDTASLNPTATIDPHHRFIASSKRKFDDYDGSPTTDGDLINVRMKKDEESIKGDHRFSFEFDTHPLSRCTFASDNRSCSSSSSGISAVHFFVRMINGGNTIVIHADSADSIDSVHEQIRRITGIPTAEQRLLYLGRQLQGDRSLADYEICTDSTLHLVGRMRSTQHPRSWQVVNDIVHWVTRLCRGDSVPTNAVRSRVKELLRMCPRDDEMTAGHIQVFKLAGVPSALVMLFLSPVKGNREIAEESIRLFLNPHIDSLTKKVQNQCASIVLEFCQLLFRTAHDDPLYVLCRSTLATLLESMGAAHGSEFFEYKKSSIVIHEFFPFANELACNVSRGLELMTKLTNCSPIPASDLRDFAAFSLTLRLAIEDRVGGQFPIPVGSHEGSSKQPFYEDEIRLFHGLFMELLEKIDQCLKKVEDYLFANGTAESDRPVKDYLFAKVMVEVDRHRTEWSQYLAVLKELDAISRLYEGAWEKLRAILRGRRFPLNTLVRYAKRSDDHLWLLEHKDVTDFETRRHLVMMMFPDVKEEFEELHEMLIDRSQLLAESFEYIGRAEPEALHGGLFMEFKNEEATGPGVLREWFSLVCKAIFNPQNVLFLSCPNDRRRFFPNPASNVDPLHLDYFGFCGRVIALALMHKVQVGIVFDRVFFLQLAGKLVSLEDIRDADPCLYMSCKQILEMDAKFLDSDALGLTFVREIEELGSRRVVELCPGGKSIIVNSKNRQEYVNCLIQHRFVISISNQVARFAKGFGDILCNPRLQKSFFESLELEDLDLMLHGSDRAMCMNDWKAHTEYNGYKETDLQIGWFWKVVEGMSEEQQRILLFFWTSVNHLPIEGFGGLASKLYIFKTSDSNDRLPTSHTCFYRLCLPPYPSMDVMHRRLEVITRDHVSRSFGIW